MAKKISSTKIFDAVSIANGASSTSPIINIEGGEAFALHLTAITGTSPSMTFSYQVAPSINGPFTTPLTPTTTFTARAVPDVLPFVPEASGGVKIIATNNGTGTIVVTAYSVVIEAL